MPISYAVEATVRGGALAVEVTSTGDTRAALLADIVARFGDDPALRRITLHPAKVVWILETRGRAVATEGGFITLAPSVITLDSPDATIDRTVWDADVAWLKKVAAVAGAVVDDAAPRLALIYREIA